MHQEHCGSTSDLISKMNQSKASGDNQEFYFKNELLNQIKMLM